MKHFKNIPLYLTVIFLSGCFSHVEQTIENEHGVSVKSGISARPLSFLHAEGTKLINEYGEETQLRGCNVGGWLLIEPWILGIDHRNKIETEKELWDLMFKRFGKEETLHLIKTFRESFFTEDDVRHIAELGMNCIRIPVWWRALMDPEYGGDIQYLDDLVDWCRKYRVYLIIDLQGAPGGQAAESSNVGEPADGGALWQDKANIDATIEWWWWIADRYKEEPVIAAYDLINEGTATPEINDLVNLYDRLYDEIRKMGDKHPIVMEEIWGYHRLPQPVDMNWSNVLYSFHVYARDSRQGHDFAPKLFPTLNRVAQYRNIPIYIGEFNTISAENGGTDEFLRWREVFDYYGWDWTFWTYKKIEPDHDINWGLIGYYNNTPVADFRNDSLETIKKSFERMETSYARENPLLKACFTAQERWANVNIQHAKGTPLLTLKNACILPAKNGSAIAEWGYDIPNIGFWGKEDRVAWTFEVARGGAYEINMRMANDLNGNVASIWIDGVHMANIQLPNSHGWRHYRDASLGVFELSKGRHTLEIGKADSHNGFINLQYAWLETSDKSAISLTEDMIRLTPVSMNPLSIGNPIRIEWQNNPPNFASWSPGASVSWPLNLQNGGAFSVTIDYATVVEDTTLLILVDGVELLQKPTPPTGDWQKYKSLESGTLTLPSGTHTLTIQWDAAKGHHTGNLRTVQLFRAPTDK